MEAGNADMNCAHATSHSFAIGDVRFQELPIPIPGSSRSCRYLLIETGILGFPVICALLRQAMGDDGLVPILLLHSPSDEVFLDDELRALIPKNVPWLHIRDGGRSLAAEFSEFELLRAMLIDPLATQSLPCVDFVDYASALGMGGEIHLAYDSGDTCKRLVWRLCKLLRHRPPDNMLCLHLRSPCGQSPLPALLQITEELERECCIDKDALFIPTALEGGDDLFHAIVLMRS